MKRLSTRHTIIVAFLIAGFCVGYFVVATYRNMQRSAEVSRNTRGALDVLHAVEEVFNDVQDIETGLKGYVLSEDSSFLNSYYNAIDRVSQHTERLMAVKQDRPRHANEINRLIPLIKAKITNSEQVMITRKTKGYNTAASIIKNGEGKHLMDSIRTIVQQIENRDRELLQVSNIEREKTAAKTTRNFTRLAVSLFLLLCIGFWTISGNLTKEQRSAAERKRMQDELEKLNRDLKTQVREKTKELTSIFDRINEGFLTVDKDYNFTYVNKKLGEMVKMDPASLIGKNVWNTFPATEGSATYTGFHKAMDNHEDVILTDYYAPFDLWQDIYIYPTPEGLSVFVADITEKKKAELAREHEANTRQLIMSSALDAIICINAAGVITLWNPQAERIFGWKEEEILGKRLSEMIIPEQYRMRHEQGMKRFKETGEGPVLNKIIEITALNREGKEFPIELSILPLEQEGELSFCAFIRDITIRRKAQDELTLSRSKYMSLVNTVDGIVWEADVQTFQFSFVSDQAERLLGYPPVAWTADANFWPDHIHPDDREWAIEYCLTCIREKKPHEFEYRMIAADGRTVWMQDFVTVILENNEAVQLRGIMVDITERKKAQQQISKEKELSDYVINSLPGIFYLFDEQGKFMRWNKNFEEVSGYSGKEIAEMHPLDFFADDEKELLKEKIGNVFVTGREDVQAHFLTKGGERIFYFFNGWLVDYEGKRGLIGMGIDISERKKAEEAILKANERFLLISKATNDFVWDAALTEKKIWWNDNYYSQLGWSREKELPDEHTWEGHIHPGDKKRVLKRVDHILNNTRDTIWSEEYRFSKADGTYINVYDRGYIMRDENGKAYRMIGAMTDLSSVKAAEEELKRSEEKYRLLFDDNPSPLWMFSLKDLRFMDVNESAINNYGYSKEEFLNMKITDIRPEEDQEKIADEIKKPKKGIRNTGLWRHIKKDGTVIKVEIVSHDTLYQGELVRLVLAIDVTEKINAEDLLKQSYEDIRQLASNLQNIREEERTSMSREVHDVLGQQLTGFKMDLYWLNRKLKTRDPEVKQKLEESLKLIDSTIQTVRKIATELRPSILDDLGLVAAMEWQSEEFEKRSGIKMYFTSTLENITVKGSVAIALFRIYQEILTNVARHSHAGKVNTAFYVDNGQLHLSVADDGDGFDLENTAGSKTLGLLGIKERTLLMKGEYHIKSSPGNGTLVTVAVPLINTIANP